MIVAERKPLEEILDRIAGANKILIVGCGECVTVCMEGGEKEVGILTELLKITSARRGNHMEIVERTVKRQCEHEFIDPLAVDVQRADVVLSMGCGCGVQLLAEHYPLARIIPALNTQFMGVTEAEGEWAERCQGCGDCLLDTFGGICPIARCAKSLLNGPCGGSEDGACEIDPSVPCAWQTIIDRLAARGELDRMLQPVPPKDWSRSRDGGPRRLSRPDVKL